MLLRSLFLREKMVENKPTLGKLKLLLFYSTGSIESKNNTARHFVRGQGTARRAQSLVFYANKSSLGELKILWKINQFILNTISKLPHR